MTTLRLLAIGFIFLCTAAAWAVLGSTVVGRTGERDVLMQLTARVDWGAVFAKR